MYVKVTSLGCSGILCTSQRLNQINKVEAAGGEEIGGRGLTRVVEAEVRKAPDDLSPGVFGLCQSVVRPDGANASVVLHIVGMVDVRWLLSYKQQHVFSEV